MALFSFNNKNSKVLVKAILSLTAVSAESKLFVRFDIWEQGNVSSLQLSDKLQEALRHALCDVLMELKVLPNPLCVGGTRLATRSPPEEAKGEFIVEYPLEFLCVLHLNLL